MKCPQCVAASLSSYVVFTLPLKDINANILYYAPNGNFAKDQTRDVYIYTCSQNHTGLITRPSDPI